MTENVIQLPAGPDDDVLEFERFMGYLDALTAAAAAEYGGLPILAVVGAATEPAAIFDEMAHEAPTWPADYTRQILDAWTETRA